MIQMIMMVVNSWSGLSDVIDIDVGDDSGMMIMTTTTMMSMMTKTATMMSMRMMKTATMMVTMTMKAVTAWNLM